MFEIIKLIFIGIILGVSNVIPGVSGGTIAVSFGIYDRLINIITLNIKKIFSQWKFWLPLGIGLVVGIIGFSKIITILFEKFPFQTNYFFIGIILGSIPLIYSKISSSFKNTEESKEVSNNKKNTKVLSSVICFILSLLLMIVMMLLNKNEITNEIQREPSFVLIVKLFIGAAFAAIAMIIPGISGSFLMLVVGVYTTIIAAISELNIVLLIPIAIGVIIGLFSGASLVRFLMKKFVSQTYSAILGLILGSVLIIFPGVEFSLVMFVSLVICFAGFSLGYFGSKKG